FINEPLKTYSSGMIMRLAFSIAIHSEPQILIVDEALSVGDAHFSAKCTKELKKLKEKNLSIIYVSHDLNSLKILCNRILLLNKGEVVYEGSPDEAINRYNFLIAKLNKSNESIKISKDSSYGTLEAEISKVEIVGEESGSDVLSSGEIGYINIYIKAHKTVKNQNIGILIRDKFAQDIFGTNTYYYGKHFDFDEGKRYKITFKMPFNIAPGKYTLTVAVHSGETHTQNCTHWADNVAEFEIAGIKGKFFVGICRLTPIVDVKTLDIQEKK
ncbi:MAG: Wzt carbohydrate-binding domain-containing protein, partial [Nautiliaceae bacterium]